MEELYRTQEDIYNDLFWRIKSYLVDINKFENSDKKTILSKSLDKSFYHITTDFTTYLIFVDEIKEIDNIDSLENIEHLLNHHLDRSKIVIHYTSKNLIKIKKERALKSLDLLLTHKKNELKLT